MKLDVEQLLTIDVDSEIRKLAEAELGGRWQVPAELVRRALRARAVRVDVDFGRHSVRVADDGPPIDPDTLRALLALLDLRQPPPVRHRALLELEGRGEVGLIALTAIGASGVRIACDGQEVLRDGAPGRTDLPRRGTVVELDGVTLDTAKAKSWLEVSMRFAPASVLVDGVEVERGSRDAIVEVPLEAPLGGTVALLRSAEGARVWLLRWGVVATHTTLPGGFPAEAAIELGDRATSQYGAGELREAFKRELTEIEAQAVEVALATASGMSKLDAADRPKVRMLLLGTPKLAKSPAVRRVKMLPALYGPTQALEWTSIDQLVHHGAGKSVLAVDSEARAANAVTHQPIFVLSSPERARLSQLFGVSFAPPPAGMTTGPLLSLRGLAESSVRAARAAAGLLAGTWQGTVPLEALSEDERAALAAFRAVAAQGGKRASFSEVEICEGVGPAFLRKKRLLLPRRSRDVVAAVKVVVKDPAWAYPALVALMGGTAMPPSAARDAWSSR